MLHDRERSKNEKRLLQCRLTDAELIDRGETLADLTRRIRTTEDNQAAEKKRMKEHLDGLKDEQRDMARIVHEREEERSVVCEVTFDFDALQVRVVRTDTGELVEARAMTDDERQMGLPMELPTVRRQ